MSLVGDIESVKTAIAAQLGSAAFLAQLAAVNAEKNDGYTTPDPAVIYDHERASMETYPAAEVVGLSTSYAADDDVKCATFRIAIVWTVVGDIEKNVTKDVERLVRTTRDVFWRSVLSGAVQLEPIHVESEDYTALASAQHPFMKGGQVILAATTLAD